MAGFDAIAAQVKVERPALGVDGPRVPDGDRADYADALGSEGGAHHRAEQKVAAPAAGRLGEYPRDRLKRTARHQGRHDLDRRSSYDSLARAGLQQKRPGCLRIRSKRRAGEIELFLLRDRKKTVDVGCPEFQIVIEEEHSLVTKQQVR